MMMSSGDCTAVWCRLASMMDFRFEDPPSAVSIRPLFFFLLPFCTHIGWISFDQCPQLEQASNISSSYLCLTATVLYVKNKKKKEKNSGIFLASECISHHAHIAARLSLSYHSIQTTYKNIWSIFFPWKEKILFCCLVMCVFTPSPAQHWPKKCPEWFFLFVRPIQTRTKNVSGWWWWRPISYFF